MQTTAKTRPRNAASTRKAILASARRLFARAGYDGVGVREIANGAGVTAMLINRYFGSKERLFAEVAAETMATPSILTREILNSPNPGKHIAAALIEQTRSGATPLDGFLITLHSASSPRAAKIGRMQIEKHHQKMVAAALRGDRRAGALPDRGLPGDAPNVRPLRPGRHRPQDAAENPRAGFSAANQRQVV